MPVPLDMEPERRDDAAPPELEDVRGLPPLSDRPCDSSTAFARACSSAMVRSMAPLIRYIISWKFSITILIWEALLVSGIG